MELEVKMVVYGRSGDFTLYNLKTGKTWNGNLSFGKGMGMWNINWQFKFGILKALCISCPMCFIHLLYTFVLSVLFLPEIYFHLDT